MHRRTWLALAAVIAGCAAPAEQVATTAPGDTVVTTTTEAPATTVAGTRPDSTSTTTTAVADTTTSPVRELAALAYEKLELGLSFPIAMAARAGSNEVWIATKDGRLWVTPADRPDPAPVLDLSSQVRNQGEQGFLGLELAPDDPNLVYVHYSAGDGDSVVSAIRMGDAGSFDEQVLVRIDQPASNHNGGMIQLGPDGALYVGLGDGGGSDDRYGNGQNTDTLLGGIVRIDPAGGEPTLWSYGLRNPWRFWFDADTLYIGDVGQNAYEEIDVVTFDGAGYNFGWPITEALHCFSPRRDCDTGGLTPPVIEVAHGDAGTCSITGGVVYRGSAIPELEGAYLYSDFCGGWLRSFRWDGSEAVDEIDWTADVGVPGSVVSFGVDGRGEVYILTPDDVYRLVPVR